jgi:predicted RNA-binding protein YlxR (DUF448 family)
MTTSRRTGELALKKTGIHGATGVAAAERMCVICRRRMPKERLHRHVCPSGYATRLVPDPGQRLPGRGFYLCEDENCRSRFAKFTGWRKKCKGLQGGNQ